MVSSDRRYGVSARDQGRNKQSRRDYDNDSDQDTDYRRKSGNKKYSNSDALLKARAVRNGRSEEEESDIEEENRGGDYDRYDRRGRQSNGDGRKNNGRKNNSNGDALLKARAVRNGRSEEEESDVEEQNRSGNSDRSNNSRNRQYSNGDGRDGRKGYNSSSGKKNSNRDALLKARAVRNGRSEEEESDIEEENRGGNYDRSDNRGRQSNGDGRKNNGRKNNSNSDALLKARAVRNGRSEEEESDLEEENRGEGSYNSAKSRRTNGNSGDYGRGSGRQGFASMSPDRVRQIGIKGRATRFGRSEEEESDIENSNQSDDSEDDEDNRRTYKKKSSNKDRNYQVDSDDDDDDRRSSRHPGNFADYDKDELRRIASKGGRNSHKRQHDDSDDDNRSYKRSKSSSNSSGSGKQGFASMSKDQVRAIASKGGRSSGKKNYSY